MQTTCSTSEYSSQEHDIDKGGTHDIQPLFPLAYLVSYALHVLQTREVALECVDVRVGVPALVPAVLADVLECVCRSFFLRREDDDAGLCAREGFGDFEAYVVGPTRH